MEQILLGAGDPGARGVSNEVKGMGRCCQNGDQYRWLEGINLAGAGVCEFQNILPVPRGR